MNSFEIDNIINFYKYAKKNFIGVFARDQLPNKIKFPSSFIINTEKSTEPGEHWLAVYYDKNGTCDFFDPLGFSPKYYKIDDYLKDTSRKYFYNTQQMQGIFSKFCGHYCILFILVKSRNYNLIFFLSLFTNNTNFNDNIIKKIIQDNFFE